MKQHRHKYYKLSGKISIHGFFLMPIICFASAIAFGSGYGYLCFNNISIYFNPLFLLLAAYFQSSIMSFLGKVFNVRNVTYSIIVFMGAAALFTASSWIVWYHGFTHSFQHRTGWVFDLEVIFSEMCGMVANGYWNIGDYVPTGDVLWAIWLSEVVIAFSIFIYRPFQVLKTRIFCENCCQWIDDVKSFFPFLSIDHTEDFVREIVDGDLKQLARLKRVPIDSTRYTQLDLVQCPACSDFHLLSIIEITRIIDSHGHEVLDQYPILTNFIITPENYEKIKQLFRDRSSPLNRKSA